MVPTKNRGNGDKLLRLKTRKVDFRPFSLPCFTGTAKGQGKKLQGTFDGESSCEIVNGPQQPANGFRFGDGGAWGMAAGFERSAHSLRHFMTTHFNDPRRAQKILGHANLKTTEIYLHELEVDMEVAGVFESITNEITNSTKEGENKGATVLQ